MESFFSLFYNMLKSSNRVSKLIPVPHAFSFLFLSILSFVPIISLEIDDIEVDLSFASLSIYPNCIPNHFDIMDNQNFKGVT